MTWGGDVADMIKNLLFKESSLGEDYNVTSSECRTWAEIAEYYHELFGLYYEWVDELTYQRFKNTNFNPAVDLPQVWQLIWKSTKPRPALCLLTRPLPTQRNLLTGCPG